MSLIRIVGRGGGVQTESTTSGLLYLPRMILRMENLVEWRLAGETDLVGEKLLQRHFSYTNPTLLNPGANPGRRYGKPATNRLIYG
jgi:hypothetical protein